MKLLEYQAHRVFREYGLPAIDGTTVSSRGELECLEEEKLSFPLVLKAQVQTGGRGKAGGIQFAADRSELVEKGSAILGMKIKDLEVEKVFLTPKVAVVQEMYLSFTMDRTSKQGIMIFSPEGGMEINEIAERTPEKVAKVLIPPGDTLDDFIIQYAADVTGLDAAWLPEFRNFCRTLYQVFIGHDCLLAEINPLVITSEGKMMALDGKVDVDDNALYRHEEIRVFRDEMTDNPLVLEARGFDFLYIPVKDSGTIAVISNGSGMIMSSIDLISKAGMDVTCALDLGGGATADRVREGLRIVASNERVDTIFLNIFGGITRCNEIARGIEGSLEHTAGTRMVVRLEGTNKEEGLEILRSLGGDLESVDGLYEGVAALSKGKKR